MKSHELKKTYRKLTNLIPAITRFSLASSVLYEKLRKMGGISHLTEHLVSRQEYKLSRKIKKLNSCKIFMVKDFNCFI